MWTRTKAEIGEAGGNDLLAAIVTILTELCDQDARTTTKLLGKLVGGSEREVDLALVLVARRVGAADHAVGGLVAAVDLLEREADLADGAAGAGGVDRELEQVAGSRARGVVQGLEAHGDAGSVAAGADLGETLDLVDAHGRVVDRQHLDRRLVLQAELVDADNDLGARVDHGLAASGRLLDAELGHAALDGLGHATELLDLADDGQRRVLELVREALDRIRASERVDDLQTSVSEESE